MGALHQGHLSLIKEGQARCEAVIASVFVNPTQFNNAGDLDAYPRDEQGDLQALESVGCDAVFLPRVEELYPQGAQTRVSVGSLADHLCGATRPGHFEGVCTVVSLLFHIVGCDVAVFGEKDAQQLAIIKQMTRDLRFPVEVVGAPTAREEDGLAMSSRNLRLSPQERRLAPSLYAGLSEARTAWARGERDPDQLKTLARARFASEARVDYLELCDPLTLQPLNAHHECSEALIAVAAFLGEVRLIDNLTLTPSSQEL
jgi:pantoate--beta-alanine ligase